VVKPVQFDKAFYNKLSELTEYEMWFLEAVYDLAGKPLFPTWPDQLIYSPGENMPTMLGYMSANIVIGDWRPSFLAAGSPLVFVTTFKLLDMFIDLVLEKNGFSQTFRFQQKISQLKNSILFPKFIECRPWLKERIIGMYETIEPLRGTIIHNKHFSTTDGNLRVSSSKRGVIGPERIIDREQLRDLTVLVISIIHYVDGTWVIDSYKERVLRRTFDTLQEFHGRPLIGQSLPRFLTVRMYVNTGENIKIDLNTIRDDLKQRCPNEDVVFDLRVIIASDDNTTLTAYLLPWSEIENQGDEVIVGHSQLSKFISRIPDDIKPEEVFQKLP
jgi:hypothetical protein